MEKKGILLLAIGNEFLCDDGVGPKAGRIVYEDFKGRIEYKEVCESGLGLLDFIVGYEKLLVIDAIDCGLEPGSVRVFDVKELDISPSPSPHSISFPTALEIAKRFNLEIPKKIKIIGVQVKDATLLSEELTEEVKSSLKKVYNEAEKILNEWLEDDS